MTGNLQAIGFLFTWVLLWCLGGIAIEALLLQAGLITPGGGSAVGGLAFLMWTLLVGVAGWASFNRITGVTQAPPQPASPWDVTPEALKPVLTDSLLWSRSNAACSWCSVSWGILTLLSTPRP